MRLNLKALDVDGVLVNFYKGACAVAGRPYQKTSQWELPWISTHFKDGVYTSEFWSSLESISLPTDIGFEFDFYVTSMPKEFIESRRKNLQSLGFPNKPIICTGHNKVPMLQYLQVSHYVDDRPQNVRDINQAGITCYQFVPDYWVGEIVDPNLAITNLDQLDKQFNLKPHAQNKHISGS